MANEQPWANELAQTREAVASSDSTWQVRETRMTRLPADDRSIRLGVPAPTAADVAARAGQPEQMAAAAADTAGLRVTANELVAAGGSAPAALPAAFDLRDVAGRSFVTGPKDQGGCGSCVAFGVVGAMESTVEYTRGAPDFEPDLSEAHLFYVHALARGYTCATGSWPDDLFADAAGIGITFEDYFPYSAGGGGTLDGDWPNRLAKAVGVSDLTGDPARIKEHLYRYGAVTACFVVYDDFFHYGGGVYRRTTDSVAGGHCVSIIGWDDALGCWIAKNSWGTGWGEGGYFRIGYGECFIEDYPGDRPTVLGCTGVSIRAWLPAQRATALFASAHDANGWAHLENFGWQYLSGGPHTTTNKLVELTHARATGRPVTAFVDGGELQTVLVSD
ncbi:MAG: C1 family peptidase [Dermatophilaceae bacterium]